MTPTERERIVEEAEGISRLRVWPEHVRVNFKNGYIAGATFEHDKVRNQAIQDCIDIVSVTPGDENVIPKLEQLKTKP